MPPIVVKANKRLLMKALEEETLKAVRGRIQRVVSSSIIEANRELIKEFLTHSITAEIKMASQNPAATNSSGVLGGYGNLFAFLGFVQGDDPVGDVADFLANSIRARVTRGHKGMMQLDVIIAIPTRQEIDKFTELPWVNKGWVTAIEKGISGLGAFIFDEDGFEASRSETGLQLKKSFRYPTALSPQSYLSDIIEKISKQLIRSIKTSI